MLNTTQARQMYIQQNKQTYSFKIIFCWAHLNKSVDIIHESLSSTNDELVHTCYSMGPDVKTHKMI